MTKVSDNWEIKPLSLADSNPRNYQQHNRPIPLQQHPAYGLTMAAFAPKAEILGLYKEDTLCASLLTLTRRFGPFFSVQTAMRGPIWWEEPIASDAATVYALIQKRARPWSRHFIVQMPEIEKSDENLRLMRSAGLKRVMSGWHTGWLTLAPKEETQMTAYEGKWRNQLRKAMGSGVDIGHSSKSNSASFRWVLEHEHAQQQSKGYQALPLDFVERFSIHAKVLAVTARHNKKQIAGGIFLIHGQSATYHIGVTSDEGRSLNAQNLVLHAATRHLYKEGVRFLDLGGFDSGPMAGIARFKMGMNPELITLSGVWSR